MRFIYIVASVIMILFLFLYFFCKIKGFLIIPLLKAHGQNCNFFFLRSLGKSLCVPSLCSHLPIFGYRSQPFPTLIGTLSFLGLLSLFYFVKIKHIKPNKNILPVLLHKGEHRDRDHTILPVPGPFTLQCVLVIVPYHFRAFWSHGCTIVDVTNLTMMDTFAVYYK